MHHRRVGQKSAQAIEFTLPRSRQLVEQRIRLALAKLQLLKERQNFTSFVD